MFDPIGKRASELGPFGREHHGKELFHDVRRLGPITWYDSEFSAILH